MLTFEQTKQAVDFALIAKRHEAWLDFMEQSLDVPQGNAPGAFGEALEKHSSLLNGKKPEELEKIFSYISKRKLSTSPLKKKLSPSQQEKMGLASVEKYPTLAKILSSKETLLSKILSRNIEIPEEEFKKEHENLLEVLDHPTPEALKKEHDKQKKEAEEEVGLKHTEASAWKWCGKCVRMTKHDNGECQEH